jgi:preprotein translocase subunit YajC
MLLPGGVAEVLAQAAAPAGDAGVYGPAPIPASDSPTLFSSFLNLLPLLAMTYLIFYFMVIKPQDTKAKSHKTLMESLKKGEMVVTSGGIVGKVAGTEKEYVVLEISNNVKVKVEHAHISKRVKDDQKAEAA